MGEEILDIAVIAMELPQSVWGRQLLRRLHRRSWRVEKARVYDNGDDRVAASVYPLEDGSNGFVVRSGC